MAKRQAKKQTARKTGDKKIYTLEVFIISGPMTRSFAAKNKVISRTIQIRGDHTLEDLHQAIFHAFNREDEHMYEFQVGGEGPIDPKARRYTLQLYAEDPEPEDRPAGYVEYTTVGSLGLKVNDAFGYWFDFGDDWRHQINVVAIEEEPKYPRVINRVGQSPPQYIDWDEDDE